MLAGQQHVQHVMSVVIPLRVEMTGQMARSVVFIFQHQMDIAVAKARANFGRHFVEPIGFGDRVNGVEASAHRNEIP